MADIVLFHHALGLTDGVLAFAGQLRDRGHVVSTPDLFEGRTFDALEQGLSYVENVGFREILQRGAVAVEHLPASLVYVGFSLGVLPAQKLAQTRSGAQGALLIHACVPAADLGAPWPDGVPVQVHAMEADSFFLRDGDIEAARALVSSADQAELFLYPGDQHLFADSSLASYDPDATALLFRRVVGFLSGR